MKSEAEVIERIVRLILGRISAYPSEIIVKEIASYMKIDIFEKGDIIQQEGVKPEIIYFLISGAVRGSVTTSDGKKHTMCIVARYGEVVYGANSLDAKELVVEGIDAILPTRLAGISIEDYFALVKKYPDLLNLYVNYLEESAWMHHDRRIILSNTPTERVLWFRERYPELGSKVQKKYIAEFLQMTPSTYSRTLTKLKSE